MNKQELIEAIEGTLASNGNKAITADALKALLLEVVDSIGEGGQGGGITLCIDFESDGNGNITSLLTPEQVAYNKAQIDILTKLHDEGKPIPPVSFLDNQSILPGAEVSRIISDMSTILWSATEEFMEELPKEAIFPIIENSVLTFMVNGDGTLLAM